MNYLKPIPVNPTIVKRNAKPIDQRIEADILKSIAWSDFSTTFIV